MTGRSFILCFFGLMKRKDLMSPRISNSLVLISRVFSVLAICYCLSLIMGCVDLFQAMLGKIGFSLGGRAFTLCLIKVGCSGGLALAIAFFVQEILTADGASSIGNFMMPTGEVPKATFAGKRWVAPAVNLYPS